jgi:hypothetical protein
VVERFEAQGDAVWQLERPAIAAQDVRVIAAGPLDLDLHVRH